LMFNFFPSNIDGPKREPRPSSDKAETFSVPTRPLLIFCNHPFAVRSVSFHNKEFLPIPIWGENESKPFLVKRNALLISSHNFVEELEPHRTLRCRIVAIR